MSALIIISILAVVVLFAGLYKAQKALLPLTLLGLAAAFVANALDWNTDWYYYNEMMRYDNFAVAFAGLTIFSTFLIILLSKDYFERISQNVAEYYTLILFALAGVVIMVSFQNLSMLFMGIEIMSVSLYILAGIRKRDTFSNEAALKYFLMGAFATGFLLFGIALVYGATGSFNLEEIATAVNSGQNKPILYAGIAMMLVGLSFKVSAAPFHFWAPDVYEGAPTLITSFMSTVVKTAGFAAFLRLFMVCFASVSEFWAPILATMAVLTLIIGNITAVYQQSFKRILAYSSVSHAGYMLLAILALGNQSANAIFIYAVAYSIASITAFAVLIRVKQERGAEDVASFNGLAKTNPFMAFALTVAMCSLAGIPLTAGFFGKFYLFSTALSQYMWLILVAIIGSMVGIYYYFKVIIAMYMRENEQKVAIVLSGNYKLVLGVALLITLLVGIMPMFISQLL